MKQVWTKDFCGLNETDVDCGPCRLNETGIDCGLNETSVQRGLCGLSETGVDCGPLWTERN